MKPEYYILQPDGTPGEGPFAEEEVLDLLDSGELNPDEKCLHAPSGSISPAGSIFRVISPEPDPEPGPVPWQPAPFPETADTPKSPGKAGPRLLYRGNPCMLTYWRSALTSLVCFAGGFAFRDQVPAMLALGLLAGSTVLLIAILHRLRTHYLVSTTRVELIFGLISRSSRELRIADIRAINVTRSGLMGLFGIGTIAFSSAAGDEDDVVFSRVSGATSLKNLVRKLQDSRH